MLKKKQFIALLTAAVLTIPQTVPVMAENAPAPAETVSETAQAETMATGHTDYGWIDTHPERRENADGLLGSTSLPSSYDLRTEGYVTPIKDQNPYGLCWSFGTIASIESNILKNGYETRPDLSELQAAWYTFSKNIDTQPEGCGKDTVSVDSSMTTFANVGGSCEQIGNSLMQRRGLVQEPEAPYCNINSPNYDNYLLAFRDDSYTVSDIDLLSAADITGVKTALLENGAAAVAVCFEDSLLTGSDVDYYDNTNDALYDPNADDTNHIVSIVGWDDSYSRTNFLEGAQPEKDGAWLIKNSWGRYGNHDGYFWLSYEDAALATENVSSFRTIPASEASDCLYQYDGGLGINCMKEPAGSSMSNVFTAGGDETLNSIELMTISDQTDVEVTVYTDVKDTPTSGNLVSSATTDALIPIAGYHTISLVSPISLKAGTKFAVCVRQIPSAEDDSFSLCRESTGFLGSSYDGMIAEVSADPGESYYSTDGKNWTDIVSGGITDDGNFMLKALTDDSVTEIYTLHTEKGSLGDAAALHFAAYGNGKTTWSLASGRIPDGLTLNAETGMLTGTYSKTGTYTFTLKAANESGTDEKEFSVFVGTKRISGTDRYNTMRDIGNRAFPEGCSTIIVASGTNWPDALAASAIAGSLNCAIALVDSDYGLELTRQLYSNLSCKNAIIIGGTGAVPQAVEDRLIKHFQKENVTRLGGSTRTETADMVAGTVIRNASSDTCLICSGSSYPDALSIASYAFSKKAPVLLTQPDGTLSAETLAIAKSFANVYIIGGTGAVSGTVESQLSGITPIRLDGADCYATNQKVISALYGNSVPTLAVATGTNYPDALAGSELTGRGNGAILLVKGTGTELTAEQAAFIENAGSVCTLGGTGAVSSAIKTEIDRLRT
jgi:C1A family cysteine protease/putative cell wall-binding protein